MDTPDTEAHEAIDAATSAISRLSDLCRERSNLATDEETERFWREAVGTVEGSDLLLQVLRDSIPNLT